MSQKHHCVKEIRSICQR